jgi:hypothetical protein
VKVAFQYSHLNGLEFLIVHKPKLWGEIISVLESIDAEKHKTKVSKEKTMMGKILYSPTSMNKEIKAEFEALEWQERRVNYYVTDDATLTRSLMAQDRATQKRAIENTGRVPFPSYNQTDFVKERVMVEIQFGKYAFVAHDLFVKHMAFFTTDFMDVGVEVLPTKALASQMSSGVPYYEGALYDLIRQGRGVPHVPLVLVGVEPDAIVDKATLEAVAEAEEKVVDAGFDIRGESGDGEILDLEAIRKRLGIKNENDKKTRK